MGEMVLLKSGTLVASRYRVREVLGRGGMGAVYRADDTRTGHVVALKALREDMYEREDLVKRFEREARAAARIGHEGIIAVRAVGHDGARRTRFIVHEYLRGADVAGCLGELRCLPVRAAIAITLRVMDALIAAHAAGIVHRDIKPENVFLHELDDGRVVPKVIDFGIAKVSDELDRMERAATGTVVGTPWYMSPEQAQGSSLVDARTDVWSVGAMLYEMVCGSPPFAGSDPDAVMAQIIFGRPTPLRHHGPTVPTDLQEVIHRALEHDLDRRYATMAEFRAALVRCQLWSDVTPADAQSFLPRPSSFDTLADESATQPEPDLLDRALVEPEPVTPPSAPLPEAPPELSFPSSRPGRSIPSADALTMRGLHDRPAGHTPPSGDTSPAPTPRRRKVHPGVGVALTMLFGAVLVAGVTHWIHRPLLDHLSGRPRAGTTFAPTGALSDSTMRGNSR